MLIEADLVDEELQSSEAATGVGIQSVEIGLAVLAAVARDARPQSLADIARRCGMARTKAHRYLTSLQRAGYVEREPGTGRYRLGAGSVQLGLAAFAHVDFSRIGSELLPRISADLGETVFMTIWGQHGATILRWEDTGQPIAVNVRVGSTMPLLRSATGQVFGAFLSAATTREVLDAELALASSNDPVRTKGDADALFEGVRQRRLGRAAGSFLSSISGVSVPVFGEAGKLAGAITSLGLLGNFPDADDGPVVQALRGWSDRLSARLGAPPVREATAG